MPMLQTFSTGSTGRVRGNAGASGLYLFNNATFTPGGAVNQYGPTLAQAISGITSSPNKTWASNGSFFSVGSGIQYWVVPATASYRILAVGARGGGGSKGGAGALMQGDFALLEGDTIKILVGQQGDPTVRSGHVANGGGGGSFVANSSNNPMVVAGGGGGQTRDSGSIYGNGNGGPAVTTQTGTYTGGNGGYGGTAGNGGSSAASGGGFYGNGVNGTWGGAGIAFINGGEGGQGSNASYRPYNHGGFGGGGGTEGASGGGPGGGGFTGGNSYGSEATGHGGGSYNNGANQSNSVGHMLGDGYVTITKL